MPRSAIQRTLLQAGRLVLAESAAAETSLLNAAGKAGRSFSSVAGRAVQSQLTRGSTIQLGKACRCSACGKIACFGHSSIHTSAAAGQAMPDVDEAPHAPSLTARCVVVG